MAVLKGCNLTSSVLQVLLSKVIYIISDRKLQAEHHSTQSQTGIQTTNLLTEATVLTTKHILKIFLMLCDLIVTKEVIVGVSSTGSKIKS